MLSVHPKITVIIPVFNGQRLISETLGSLRNQTLSDFEVICVDDCSTDESRRIIEKICLIDSRFKYIRTPENFGYAAKVINFAIEKVNGLYYMYSSQDDIFSEDLFEKAISVAEAEDADIVIPDLEFYYPKGSVNVRKSGIDGDRSIVLSGKDAFLLSLDWTIPGNGIVRTKLIKKYRYFDFGTYADGYTARYFFLKSERVAFCDGVFFYSQDNPEAITKKISPSRLDWPYTAYRIWKLAHDNFPTSRETRLCALRAARSLYYAEIMIFQNRSLKMHRSKIVNARREMRSKVFLLEITSRMSLEAVLLILIVFFPTISRCTIVFISVFKDLANRSGVGSFINDKS